MKKILIPTDFSANAWDALEYALRFFDNIPCCFYILNTYELVVTADHYNTGVYADGKLLELLKDNSEKQLLKIKNHLEENLLHETHQYKILSEIGNLTSVVKNIVEKEGIDLIIMGTTGATGLKEVLMGTNTINVINTVKNCPVIGVPENYEYEEPSYITFATNLKNLLSVNSSKLLLEIAELHNLDIELLHIKKEKKLNQDQELVLQSLKTFFGDKVSDYNEVEYPTTSVADSITEYTKDTDVTLLCMVNSRHGLLYKLTHESILKKVGFHTQTPLLVLPD